MDSIQHFLCWWVLEYASGYSSHQVWPFNTLIPDVQAHLFTETFSETLVRPHIKHIKPIVIVFSGADALCFLERSLLWGFYWHSYRFWQHVKPDYDKNGKPSLLFDCSSLEAYSVFQLESMCFIFLGRFQYIWTNHFWPMILSLTTNNSFSFKYLILVFSSFSLVLSHCWQDTVLENKKNIALVQLKLDLWLLWTSAATKWLHLWSTFLA